MTYGRNGGTKVHLVDTGTGAVREVPLGPSQGDTFVGTGDGFLIHVSTPNGVGYDQLRLMNGSSAFTANFPVAGYVQAADARADARGVLLEWIEFDGGNGHVKLSYLDFGTKKWTKLADVREIGTIAMSPTQIAWLTGGDHVHRLSRSALGSTPSVYVTPTPLSVLALNGTSMAWESDSVGGSQDRITRIWTKASGKAPVKLNVQAAWPTPLGSGFAVASGTTRTTAGIYRLPTGSTSLGSRLVASGPDSPLSVTQSAGRFLYQSPTRRTAVSQRIVKASTGSATPKLTVAAATTLSPTSVVGVTPVASGGHTATYECPSSCDVVVRDGDDVIRRIAFSDSVVSLGLSGNNLLVAAAHETSGGQASTRRSTTSAARLRRCACRTPTPCPGGASRSSSRTRPSWFATCPDPRPSIRSCALRSCLLAPRRSDRCSPRSGSPGTGCSGRSRTTSSTPRRPWPLTCPTARRSGSRRSRRSDWSTARPLTSRAGDRSVHVVDLATRTDTVVGRAQLETSNRQWLAMSNEVVAFVASNDTTHLVPLSGVHVVSAAPRVEGTIRPAASSLVRPLRVQLDASRPLSSWQFVVTDSSGRTVFASRGSAPDGGARPVWSGRTTGGARVRDGVYSWRIVASGPGGSLVEGPGARGATRGSVRLDTVAPRASMSVPRRVPRTGVDLRWRAGETSRFTVTVSKRVRKHGRWTWTTPRTWLRTSATTGAVRRQARALPARPRRAPSLRARRRGLCGQPVRAGAAHQGRALTGRRFSPPAGRPGRGAGGRRPTCPTRRRPRCSPRAACPRGRSPSFSSTRADARLRVSTSACTRLRSREPYAQSSRAFAPRSRTRAPTTPR